MNSLPCNVPVRMAKRITFNVPKDYRLSRGIKTGEEALWLMKPNDNNIYLRPMKHTAKLPEDYIVIKKAVFNRNGIRGCVVCIPSVWAQRQNLKSGHILTIFETAEGWLGVRR